MLRKALGIKHDIFRVLPNDPPGVTIDWLMRALEDADAACSYGSMRMTISLMRSDNSIREDRSRPRHYWRGPVAVVARPYHRAEARPFWTRPGPELLEQCRLGRHEIQLALKMAK
jgi:hypothetical protein